MNCDLGHGSITKTICNFWVVPHCVNADQGFQDGTMNSHFSQHACLASLLHGNGTIMIFLPIIILPFLGGPAFSNNDDHTYDVMDLDLERMRGMWFGRGSIH